MSPAGVNHHLLMANIVIIDILHGYACQAPWRRSLQIQGKAESGLLKPAFSFTLWIHQYIEYFGSHLPMWLVPGRGLGLHAKNACINRRCPM
jgi:hypothetical protein